MKKSLLALAVLGAFAATAQAQTSVQVFGSFDGGVRYVDNVVNAAGTDIDDRLSVSSTGTYNSNRLGFRGTEDLGGGLSARFHLETGFNTGNGSVAGDLFGRRATVGLGGSWGGIDIGRNYSVSFYTIGGYDPFNYKFTGIIPLATAAAGSPATRFNNDIQYTGNFGPVTVRAEYALGEQVGSISDGSAAAIGGTFATGPFSFGGAYTKKDTAITGAGFQDYDQWTVGGAWKAGPIRVAAGYIDATQEQGALPDLETTNAWLGASYALSPAAEITAAYYRTETEVGAVDGKRDLFIIGATYALSKRTNFYTNFDYSKLDDAAVLTAPAAGLTEDKVIGFSVGINHLF